MSKTPHNRIYMNRFAEHQLADIQRAVLASLEKYKHELSHILRYWANGYVVPETVEQLTKVLVKQQYPQKGDFLVDPHTGDQIGLIKGANRKMYNGMSYYGIILPNDEQVELYAGIANNGLHTIRYNGADYNELPESGNTYRHTLTQAHDIRQFAFMDHKHHGGAHGVFLLETLNYLHDIPEKFKGDVVAHLDNKGDSDVAEERNVLNEVVEEMSISEGQQDFLKELYTVADDDASMFKFYERLRYLKDAINVFHRDKYGHRYNNPDALVYGVIGNQLPKFTNEIHSLDYSFKGLAIELQSVQKFIDIYRNDIDAIFAYFDVQEYSRSNNQENENFAEAKNLWKEKLRDINI